MFIAIEAQEIEHSSLQAKRQNFSLPHIDVKKQRNIYGHHIKKLERKNINSEIDLAALNESKLKQDYPTEVKVDPLEIDGDL